ncbi:hypothetical protein [Streptomyces misionensis]|uniref:hypothetical protein n=1 Tax=Streptomyces misionensis TaxID=67331 RepID=UPI0033A0AC09
MGCNCGKNRQANGNTVAAAKPETYEVVLPGGKVPFKHSALETVKVIANRYDDAVVRERSSGRIVHESTKTSAAASN